MTKEEALKVWLHEFGDVDFAHDFTGRKVKRSDYLVENQVGWVVSYVKPVRLGGPKDEGNTIILNQNTAYEKGDSYPIFEIVGVKYQAFHDTKEDYYYIEKVEED
jgi:hypothetical protein